MGDAVVTGCLDFLNGDGMLPRNNRTNVVLIPKKESSGFAADFLAM